MRLFCRTSRISAAWKNLIYYFLPQINFQTNFSPPSLLNQTRIIQFEVSKMSQKSRNSRKKSPENSWKRIFSVIVTLKNKTKVRWVLRFWNESLSPESSPLSAPFRESEKIWKNPNMPIMWATKGWKWEASGKYFFKIPAAVNGVYPLRPRYLT